MKTATSLQGDKPCARRSDLRLLLIMALCLFHYLLFYSISSPGSLSLTNTPSLPLSLSPPSSLSLSLSLFLSVSRSPRLSLCLPSLSLPRQTSAASILSNRGLPMILDMLRVRDFDVQYWCTRALLNLIRHNGEVIKFNV